MDILKEQLWLYLALKLDLFSWDKSRGSKFYIQFMSVADLFFVLGCR